MFIWGFSPVLGRYITVDAFSLVWYRIAVTVLAMYLYARFKKISLQITRKDNLVLIGTGLIILIHWLCFYGAIKVSNISVTMVSFSTGTLFSSIIEPILFKRKIRFYEVLLGLIIISGMVFIFNIETSYRDGIYLGILAALTGATFSGINGLMISKVRATVISLVELLSAFIGLTIILLLFGKFDSAFFKPDHDSVIGILLLSLVCTVFPFIASVNLLKNMSPYTQVLTVNLETVYGIIWAIFLYNENKDLNPKFYIGVIIILAAVFINPIIRKRLELKKETI